MTFLSQASNLDDGDDTDDEPDAFVHDRRTRQTTRLVSGHQLATPPSISANGRYLAWTANSAPEDAVAGVYVHDRRLRATARIAVGYFAEISSDGRHVVHQGADELTYLTGLETGISQLVSIDARGKRFRCRHPEAVHDAGACTQSPTVSRDGRFVAFSSLFPRFAFDWIAIYVRDRRTRKTRRLYAGTADPPPEPRLSADGRFIAFRTFTALVREDTNHKPDIYVTGPLH